MQSKLTKFESVHQLLIKLPESFSAFCVTISLLPNTPDMSTFVVMLQDKAMSVNPSSALPVSSGTGGAPPPQQ